MRSTYPESAHLADRELTGERLESAAYQRANGEVQADRIEEAGESGGRRHGGRGHGQRDLDVPFLGGGTQLVVHPSAAGGLQDRTAAADGGTADLGGCSPARHGVAAARAVRCERNDAQAPHRWPGGLLTGVAPEQVELPDPVGPHRDLLRVDARPARRCRLLVDLDVVKGGRSGLAEHRRRDRELGDLAVGRHQQRLDLLEAGVVLHDQRCEGVFQRAASLRDQPAHADGGRHATLGAHARLHPVGLSGVDRDIRVDHLRDGSGR